MIDRSKPRSVASDLEAPFDAKFLARLEKLHLCSRRVFSGRQHAQHVSKKLGTGMEFVDHRPYAVGDDLRLLDWNLFGRSDKLYTKLFRQEEDRNLFFLVDVSASMASEAIKFDTVRRLVAAVAYIGLVEMDRVHLMGFGEGISASRPVLRGRRSVVDALRFLSRLKASGQTDLRRTCHEFLASHRGQEGMVLVFSDFMDIEGWASGLDLLFRQGYEVVALHLLTEQELKPRRLGEWRLMDPEGGRPHTVHITRRMIARYREALNAHGERLRRHVLARGGSYIRATTASALEELVLKELRAGHLLA